MARQSTRVNCPVCSLTFKASGLNRHITAKHPAYRQVNPINNARSHPITNNHANLIPDADPGQPPATEAESDIATKLQQWRRSGPLVSRIPKGSRIAVAESFVSKIRDCVDKNDSFSWCAVLVFAYAAFYLPEPSTQKKVSLTTIVRNNLRHTDFDGRVARKPPKHPKDAVAALKQTVVKKIAEGDISGAVRFLSSDDTIATASDEVLLLLKEKHPQALADEIFPPAPATADSFVVTNREIKQAILSFKNGSAGGIDGLKPQHLKDLISGVTDIGDRLCSALAELVALMIEGRVPEQICPVLYGAALTALSKKDGGLRPIAVGSTLRPLAGKIVSQRVMSDMGELLRQQLGYGSSGGAEAAVHAARAFCMQADSECRILFQLDFRNAFNTIDRSKVLHEIKEQLPQYYNFVWQMYRRPSTLFYGPHRISSECGVQQGDPLGPLLFCLAIRHFC